MRKSTGRYAEGRETPFRRWAALALCAACVALLAVTAQAQFEAAQAPGESTGVDTAYTPTAKDPPDGLVTLVAGTRFDPKAPKPENLIAGSVTSFDTDLNAVAFRNANKGFAGGSENGIPVVYSYTQAQGWQKDRPLQGPGHIAAIAWIDEHRALAVGGTGKYPEREKADGSSTCAEGGKPQDDEDPSKGGAGKARAWIYDERWRELRGPDSQDPEIPPDMRALIALDFYLSDPDDPAKPKPFGIAGGLCQLWHWQDTGFLKDADGFERAFGAEAPADSPKRIPSLVFRVRDVSFARLAHMDPPLGHAERRNILAFAVTSGCCFAGADKAETAEPLVLQYPDTSLSHEGRACPDDPFGPRSCPWPFTSSSPDPARDGAWGVVAGGGSATVSGSPDAPTPSSRAAEPDSFVSVTATRAPGPQSNGDSPPVRFMEPGVIASPIGPLSPSGLEPASTVGKETVLAFSLFSARAPGTTGPSDTRLLAGDGDIGGGEHRRWETALFRGQAAPIEPPLGSLTINDRDPAGGVYSFGNAGSSLNLGGKARTLPDGIPDWSVGERRMSGQAVALATDPGQVPGPREAVEGPTIQLCASPSRNFQDGVNGKTGDIEEDTDCNVTTVGSYPAAAMTAYDPGTRGDEHAERPGKAIRSHRLFKVPSYRLNAIDVVDEAGIGWAVGDHGAIVRLTPETSKAKKAGEPEPPELGKPEHSPVPDLSLFKRKRPPPASRAGIVPPLHERPKISLAEPRMQMVHTTPNESSGFGSGTTKKIIMSRDASEGWAFSTGRPMALTHFDGARWTYCDPSLEASELKDPACLGLTELRSQGYTLIDAARVPNENDSDPTNDDDFEVAAVASMPGTTLQKILRYRTSMGWSPELDERVRDMEADPTALQMHSLTKARAIAFTAPNDGWILTNKDVELSGPNEARDFAWQWFHFDGASWRACGRYRERRDECDPDRLLPQTEGAASGRITGLAVAGRRLFAFGFRNATAKLPRPVSNTDPNSCDSAWAGHCQIEALTPITTPLVLVRDAGDAGWSRSSQLGAYDAASASTTPLAGRVRSLTVAVRPGGGLEGWALGPFPPGIARNAGNTGQLPGPALLHLPPGGRWAPFADSGVFAETARKCCRPESAVPPMEIVPVSEGALSPAYIGRGNLNRENLSVLNTRRARWEAARAERPFQHYRISKDDSQVTALAPDGTGGLWVRLEKGSEGSFFRYTERPNKPVFTEAPPPSMRLGHLRYTSLGAAQDGTVWAATNSDTLYHYDRVTGWDAIRIKGWDPGRVVTSPSAVNAIAVSPGGEGLAVGPGGRIARVSPGGVVLDPAAGNPCGATPVAPCGSARHLRAVAVGRDGSAVIAGENRTVLWRPAGGELRAITPPSVPSETTFAGAAIASGNRIWLISGAAREKATIYAGSLEAGRWSWRAEHSEERPAGVVEGARWQLHAIVVDWDGNGYAVGDEGVLLERRAEGGWIKIPPPFPGRSLRSVTLAAGGGEGVLIGGEGRLILTKTRKGFEVARPPDYPASPRGSAEVTGLALLPGVREGETEAWALGAGSSAGHLGAKRAANNVLFHYASDEKEPLLRPGQRTRPVRDTPAPGPDELAIAAFGKSDCQDVRGAVCGVWEGGLSYEEEISRRIVDELSQPSRQGDPVSLAVFTGDAVDSGGYHGSQASEDLLEQGPRLVGSTVFETATHESADGPTKLRRWGEAVADRLTDSGTTLLGVPGAQDVSDLTPTCATYVPSPDSPNSCYSTKQASKQGENLSWRQAMALRPRPWGAAKNLGHPRYRLRRVGERGLKLRLSDPETPDPDGEGSERGRRVPAGGADTHYAMDVYDRGGQKPLARLILLDNSQGSLSASDPLQQPLEPTGQLAWLQRVLCVRGQFSGVQGCTREPGQMAIVVTNAPTYSYGPGTATETSSDGAVLEASLLRHGASLVVSGRIGWNGLYWASAPGVHQPCPGGEYPTGPPTGDVGICGNDVAPGPSDSAQAKEIAAAIENGSSTATDPPAAPEALPFLVASGAGGKFSGRSMEVNQGEARDGFWHGYSVARLSPDAGPRKLVVEQRPIYDFVGIEAQAHTLRPGQRMTLRGFGRGPVGYRREPQNVELVATPIVRYDRIDSAAVTHRYDLFEADSERPWLPQRDAAGEPVPLDPSVATVDVHSGVVRAGRGDHPPRLAVAMLSVNKHVATYSMVFEPRRTFKPSVTARPRHIPNVTVRSAQVGINPPTSPGAPPQVGSVSPPALPSFPTVSAPPATPPLGQPQPAPPPPPPPAPPIPAPLQMAPAPPGLTVAPPSSVIPPPAPPINPAPPGGARKEARQRQAATEKSGSGAEQAHDQGVDLAEGPKAPEGAAMTRRDRAKASPSFTTISGTDQPSAWTRTALYGGGLTAMAIALAAGYTAWPRPRRRMPTVPAPARITRRPRL